MFAQKCQTHQCSSKVAGWCETECRTFHDLEYKDLRPSSYPLRIDDTIRDKLEAAAARYGRSLNTEIAIRLEASLLQDDQAEPMPASEELMRRIAYEVSKQVVKEALAFHGFDEE